MSTSVPVSDGVPTPLPQPLDQDLEISVLGVVSRPPGSPSIVSPSLSLATAAPPYDPAPLPRSLHLFLRLASLLFPGLVLLFAALPVMPALLLIAAVLPLRLPLCLLRVSHRVPLLPTLVPGSSVRSPLVPIMLAPLTGGPLSARCAHTSMPILLGSSLVMFPWIGFVVWVSALARFARGF